MTCGKICSGKSTYAEKLRIERKAVVLSVDEITLALFGGNAGDKHDDYVERTEKYLFEKSLDILENDTNVILDWGFWTKAERQYARDFYASHGIRTELHYIEISDEEWQIRINMRNYELQSGKISAYYVDEGLAEKSSSIFEPPEKHECDFIIQSLRI